MTAAFVALGNALRKFVQLRDWTIGHMGIDVASIIGCSMILISISTMNGFTDIASDNIGVIYPIYISVWLYMITGTIGTYITFATSSLIVQTTTRFKNFMLRVGNVSQEIYEVHPMILRLAPLVYGLFGLVVLNPIEAAPQLWVLNYIFIAVISIPLVFYVINKVPALRLMFTGSTKE